MHQILISRTYHSPLSVETQKVHWKLTQVTILKMLFEMLFDNTKKCLSKFKDFNKISYLFTYFWKQFFENYSKIGKIKQLKKLVSWRRFFKSKFQRPTPEIKKRKENRITIVWSYFTVLCNNFASVKQPTKYTMTNEHCAKSAQIKSFFWSVFFSVARFCSFFDSYHDFMF